MPKGPGGIVRGDRPRRPVSGERTPPLAATTAGAGAMHELQGRNAVLTGASRGLGAHLARALADEGVNLALVARSAEALEEVREDASSRAVNAIALPTDLSDASRVPSIVDSVEAELGPVDLLVNNAGVELTAPYDHHPFETIEAAVKVNLLATMLLTRAVLPGMRSRGRGHVVNMSSLAGKIGLPLQTPYGATKAALIMFTHSLRAELIHDPVGVSVVCPGFVAGDGMYARIEAMGRKAPRMLSPTTTKKVTEAVVRAMRRDIAETIVNPLPARPLGVLREAVPAIASHIPRALGAARFAREVSVQRRES